MRTGQRSRHRMLRMLTLMLIEQGMCELHAICTSYVPAGAFAETGNAPDVAYATVSSNGGATSCSLTRVGDQWRSCGEQHASVYCAATVRAVLGYCWTGAHLEPDIPGLKQMWVFFAAAAWPLDMTSCICHAVAELRCLFVVG